MERKQQQQTPQSPSPRHAASGRAPQPLPQTEVLTLADDAGAGGDPYNSAGRWTRREPDDA